MPPSTNWTCLRRALDELSVLSNNSLHGADGSAAWEDLKRGSALGAQTEELRDRSVLIATTDQFTAALALIELDGVARRLVLAPSDLPAEHLPFVLNSAEVEAIVSDRPASELSGAHTRRFVSVSSRIAPAVRDLGVAPRKTEWILLTSGTTGRPKLTAHTLASLTGAIEPRGGSAGDVVWSTFYDIRRYGGLQIFLRAALTGATLVLSSAAESTADFLERAGAHGVTHISGTPSHWRRALMSPAAGRIAPRYVRLSGEIADQAILNNLQSFYPQANVAHAFASTEAGVAFDVRDGLAGFPASVLDQTPDVAMKVENGSLKIRSARNAGRYLGDQDQLSKDADGFVDTGDMLELRDGRFYFVGRRDGVINVGGLKVYPEEVEAVINRHAAVQMSLVRTRKSPITGALVVADVALRHAPDDIPELRREILQLCRDILPAHKVPASINFVPSLTVAETGKMMRRDA